MPGAAAYLEVVHCYVKVRAKGANAVHLPIYNGKIYHETCLLPAERGEQLAMELDSE